MTIMKNRIIASAAIILLFFAACGSSEKPNAAGADTSAVKMAGITYTCPMHPEIVSDMPGKCSICKMDLVEKKNAAGTDTSSHDGHQH